MGENIRITAKFSKPITVVGVPGSYPYIELNTQPHKGLAKYESASGTSVTFSYVVGPNENTGSLDVATTNSLTLFGGSITDSVANPAILTLPADKNGSVLGSNGVIIDGQIKCDPVKPSL